MSEPLLVSLVVLLSATLTTYRISVAVAREDGPFACFLWLRNRFLGENWLADGIRCPYCISVWVGLSLGLYLAYLGYYPWNVAVLVGLGFSGATLVLDKFWRSR